MLAEIPVSHVLPLTESAMYRLWDQPGSWTARLHPCTDAWQRALLRSKHAMIDHMAARGLAVPVQTRITDALDLDALAPAVVKGATGTSGKMVRIAETRAELAAAVARARAMPGDWVVQELITGPTYLVGGLFHDGRPLRIYAAEKLEQHPPRTGGAIRLRSIAEPALVDAGLAAMRELRWTGFASADLMRRPDGRYVLLEINPRLWGSLAGATSAGVDLFTPFAELLAGGSPPADLAFAANDECMIFPRYLNAAHHRTLAGVRQAVRDLLGHQGRDWRDPPFVLHILRRLFWMRRSAQRF
jgi:biotin carboxylase